MDVGCSQWWSPASTMVPQYHLVQSYYSIFPKNHPPHLHRCYSVRVHPYAHPQIMKVLKHFIYLQYGCGMQFGTSCSLNHDTTTSFGSTLPHLNRCYSVRVHPYAQPQHMNVLKHFIYIQYGCGMQSARVCSLNHDITMSFGPHLTPMLQNWNCPPPPLT